MNLEDKMLEDYAFAVALEVRAAIFRRLSSRTGINMHESWVSDHVLKPIIARVPKPTAVGQVPLSLTSIIHVSAEDVQHLADFAGVGDEDTEVSSLMLWVGEYLYDKEDGTTGKGYGLCASLSEYPEEGCLPLTELNPPEEPTS